MAEVASRQEGKAAVTEDRGARAGDTLTVDFLGKVGDFAFPGGTGTDMAVKLGGAGFIPGFSEGMEGMKPGETRTIHVTFPEEYHAKDLAGKPATFELTAKSLEEPVPAAVDDALATSLGLESLEKLREAVSGADPAGVRPGQPDEDQAGPVGRAIEGGGVPGAGEHGGERSSSRSGSGWRRTSKADKLDDEDKGKDEETLKGEYRTIAERRVRLGLLLSDIGRVNGIQVQPDELTRAMRAEAQTLPGAGRVQSWSSSAKTRRRWTVCAGPIYEDKVIDFILELAKVEDKVVAPDELSADPETPAA